MATIMRGAAACKARRLSGVALPAPMFFATSLKVSPATETITISVSSCPSSETPPMVSSGAALRRKPLIR